MIWEFLEYCTAGCPRWAKRMGYLEESIAIEARYGRCRKAWNPHLLNCQRYVAKCIEAVTGSDRVIVLGSGSLLDIPFGLLKERFAEVVLVDVVHPKSSRSRCGKDPRFRMIEADVTGLADKAFEGDLPEETDRYFLEPILANGRADLVVSANLLSQLPNGISHWLRKAEKWEEKQLAALSKRLIREHLELLPQLAPRACLITDVEERVYDAEGSLRERNDLTWGQAMPPHEEEWNWDLAPVGEVDRKTRLELTVRGHFMSEEKER